MAHGRAAVALAAAATVSLVSLHAGAYCRTTTCDVAGAEAGCTADPSGCATSGKPLFWPSDCGWYGVQKDGSPLLKISYDEFHSVVVKAFSKWGDADCGGGKHPSFAMQDTDVLYEPVVCGRQEFNQGKDLGNASVWMFRDKDWPYQGVNSTIALTTLTVEIPTGKILDADVELNSFGTNISTSDTKVTADLESIVTHESGHFLGLAHSSDRMATMFAQYSASSTTIRTLALDDMKGICAVYPPASSAPACLEPSPLTGFSVNCGGVNPITKPVIQASTTTSGGCSVSGTRGASPTWPALALAALLGAARWRRRRPR